MSHIWPRAFGDIRVSVISEATGWWPIDRAIVDVPEAEWRREIPTNAEDQLEIGFNLAHVTLPVASILIDTGFGDYDPTDRENPIVSGRDVRMTDGLDLALESLAVPPDHATHPVISHMHAPHILPPTRLTARHP